MLTKEKKRITLAVGRLDAVQISPLRYAHYADETSSWWIVSRRDVIDFGEMLEEGVKDAYSLWCAGSVGREMPRGWQP